MALNEPLTAAAREFIAANDVLANATEALRIATAACTVANAARTTAAEGYHAAQARRDAAVAALKTVADQA